MEEKPSQLIVRPKSVTRLTYGMLKGDPRWLEQILADAETGGLALDYGEPPAGLHTNSSEAGGLIHEAKCALTQ